MRSFDLRKEIRGILYGSPEGPGIGRPLLVRRITDRKCVCWDISISAANPNCKYCGGEGFLWTETLETGYISRNFGSVLNPATVISQQNALNAQGYGDENRALCFFEYSVFPNYERYSKPDHPSFDKLYELKVDDNGDLSRPAARTSKWMIKSLIGHHGDSGRIEYFELGLSKEQV